MLAPMAIEKGGPLASLAHDLRRLSGGLPVRRLWADGSVHAFVFVANTGGDLDRPTWSASSQGEEMNRNADLLGNTR
jgi:hypothetical protein